MKIAYSAQMRDIDRRTVEEYGICGLVLMERAALSVVNRIKEITPPQKTVVLCGGGNNGGDGLAVARMLWNEGWNVKVFFLAKESNATEDCKRQLRGARKFGVPVVSTRPDEKDLHAALIVDAIFGTGLNKNITNPLADVIEFVNRNSNGPVVAVDIPSGISSDTGKVMGKAIRADHTVTFGLPKPGHFLHPGREHTGELTVAQIGFPLELLENRSLKLEIPEKEQMAAIVPERPVYSHKGSFGHVLLISGSAGKTGAAMLAAGGAFRVGAGLVTIGVPGEFLDIFETKVVDEMTLPLPSSGGMLKSDALKPILDFLQKRADVLAIGPGLGVWEGTEKLMPALIKASAAPMVIDADGLNSLKGNYKILEKAKAPVILTPHPGEMGRLLDITVREVEGDRMNVALFLARQSRAFVVLKGVPTVVATPDGRAFINPTGTPAMAKAGVGDVLTGIIAGLLAQHLDPQEASVLGVYLHGLAGEISSAKKGIHSVMASDLHKSIPLALKSLSETGTAHAL